MKWQDAVNLSSTGTAERNSEGNERDPWRIYVWTSRQNNLQIRVYTGRRKNGKHYGATSTTSVKRANMFEDWQPVDPWGPLKLLVMAGELNGELRLPPARRTKRKRKKRSSQ